MAGGRKKSKKRLPIAMTLFVPFIAFAMPAALSHPSCPLAKKGDAGSALQTAEMLRVQGDEGGAYRCYWAAAEWREDCDPGLWEMVAGMAERTAGKGPAQDGYLPCYQLGRAASCHAGAMDARLARHVAHAECYRKVGNMTGAARALRAMLDDDLVRREDPGSCLHAANQVAELAMSGAVPWQFAEESFEMLHKGWSGNGYSLRSFGLIKTQVNRVEEALSLFQQSLKLLPDHYTHSQALVACNQLKRFDEALEHARACIDLQPGNPEYLRNFGSALVKLGRFEEALPHLLRAQKLVPSDHSVYIEIGFAHMGVGRLEEAAEMMERGIELGAPNFRLWLFVASAYTKANLHHKARRAHLKAVKACKRESKGMTKEERKQECLLALGRYLESLQRDCDWSKWEQYAQIEDQLLSRTAMERVLTPFQVNKGPFSLHALRNLTQREAQKKIPEIATPLPLPPPLLSPLRVGMLWTGTYDSEFANNVVSVLEMDPILRAIETNRLQLFWFSINDHESDGIGHYKSKERIRKLLGDRFLVLHTEVQRPDDGAKHEGVDCASSIRKFNLHMLFNLPGWLNEATMSVSAAIPCALQVAFKGYAGTLGASYVQHLLTDRISSPPELSHGYTEKLVYMPHSFYPVGNLQTYRRDSRAGIAVDRPHQLREELGLPAQGALVFGAFNDHYKIDPQLFRMWMRLLRSSNGSVIWTIRHGGEAILQKEAVKEGIDPARLVIAEPFPKVEHLAIKGYSDVFLDTHLYNGHSTTSDMLWAQVPVVTLPGEKMAARTAAGIMAAANAAIGIARNHDDYFELSKRLAQVAQRLRGAGEILHREQLSNTKLFNMNLFADNLLR